MVCVCVQLSKKALREGSVQQRIALSLALSRFFSLSEQRGAQGGGAFFSFLGGLFFSSPAALAACCCDVVTAGSGCCYWSTGLLLLLLLQSLLGQVTTTKTATTPAVGLCLSLEHKHLLDLLHLVLLVEVGHQAEPGVDALEVLFCFCVGWALGG
jgi:hypothetical protein